MIGCVVSRDDFYSTMELSITSRDHFCAVALLAAVRHRVERLLVRYRIPSQDGEDLVQQAVVALLYRQNEIRDPEAWFLGTLRNKCRLYWRDRHRFGEPIPCEGLGGWSARPPEQERRELRRDLERAIADLPPRCKNVLRLKYGFGFAADEMAEALGYRPSSIQKVTARCLSALAQRIEASRAVS